MNNKMGDYKNPKLKTVKSESIEGRRMSSAQPLKSGSYAKYPKPLQARLNRVDTKTINIGATYIKDAIQVRRPQLRIKDPGSIICKCIQLPKPITTYNFVHGKLWKRFLFIVIWYHLLLVIVEPADGNYHRNNLVCNIVLIYIVFDWYILILNIYIFKNSGYYSVNLVV